MRRRATFLFSACVFSASASFSFAAEPAPVVAAPASSVAPTDPKVYFSGNEWFSVAADRVPASNYAAWVAGRVAGALKKYGFTETDIRPERVTVYVNSGDGTAEISTEGGHTLVRIPLRSLPAETTVADFAADRVVCRAMVRAALIRLAQAAGRQPAPSDWIVEALAWESQVAAYPGLLEWLMRTASEQGPGSFDKLGESNPDSLGGHSRASFILLRALKTESKADFRFVVAKAAMGRPIAECVDAAVPGLSKDLLVWWPAAFYREIDRRPSAVSSPSGSARRFAEISRFVVYETPAGEKDPRDIVLDVAGLIARRGDNAVRADAERRIIEIKRELLRTNPVWFNSLRDYGVFLEKLPTASAEELSGLAFDVMAEAKIASNLTAEIEKTLRGGL